MMGQCESVRTPLLEFCQLARQGAIPGQEVSRLVTRYKRKPDLEKIREKILEDARRKIDEVGDPRKVLSVCIVVVGFSPYDQDVEKALGIINGANVGQNRNEALAALVRVLVETNRLESAKQITEMMDDAYWKAEALLCIACVSQESADFDEAIFAAAEITREDLKDDVIDDVEYARAHRIRPTSIPSDLDFQQKSQAVTQLVRSLVTLNNLEEIINAALAIESAYWQINVLAVIYEALRDLT